MKLFFLLIIFFCIHGVHAQIWEINASIGAGKSDEENLDYDTWRPPFEVNNTLQSVIDLVYRPKKAFIQFSSGLGYRDIRDTDYKYSVLDIPFQVMLVFGQRFNVALGGGIFGSAFLVQQTPQLVVNPRRLGLGGLLSLRIACRLSAKTGFFVWPVFMKQITPTFEIPTGGHSHIGGGGFGPGYLRSLILRAGITYKLPSRKDKNPENLH